MRVMLERWSSSENQEEIHFFLQGGPTYVFGYNPDVVPYPLVEALLKEIGAEVRP